jgi:hypothetical protein
MQNEFENNTQEPNQVNTGFNEPPVVSIPNLEPANNEPLPGQNRNDTAQNRFRFLDAEAGNRIKKFINALGFLAIGAGNISSMQGLFKKNKSDQEKALALFFASVVIVTDIMVATAILLRTRRNRNLNSLPNTNDTSTIASSDNLSQDNEQLQNQELRNQPDAIEEGIELQTRREEGPVNNNSDEFTLNNLAVIPERINRTNSLNSSISTTHRASLRIGRPQNRSLSF